MTSGQFLESSLQSCFVVQNFRSLPNRGLKESRCNHSKHKSCNCSLPVICNYLSQVLETFLIEFFSNITKMESESSETTGATSVKVEAIEVDEELVTTPKTTASNQEMSEPTAETSDSSRPTRYQMIPTTMGRGFVLVDQEEEQRLREENEKYKPFHRRLRTDEENMLYVEQEKQRIAAKIAKENKARLSNKLDRSQKMRIDPNADFIRFVSNDEVEHGYSRQDLQEFYRRHGLDRPFRFDEKLPIIRVKDEVNTLFECIFTVHSVHLLSSTSQSCLMR